MAIEFEDTDCEEIKSVQLVCSGILLHQSSCYRTNEFKPTGHRRRTSSVSTVGTDTSTLVTRPPSLNRVRLQAQRGLSDLDSPLPLGAFPEWPTPEGQIRLQLNEWTRLLRIHLGKLEEQCDRVRKILEYFMEEARRNRLGESSAVRILRNCLDELKLTDTDLASDDGTAAKDLWQSRIGQRKIQDVRQNMKYGAFGESPSWLPTDSRLSTSLINKMPLFNLWDSLSFIYTKAVEPIVCQRQAELHLYQFWTIIRILKDCEQYFVSFATPTMAAATWTKERERTKPHIIAFATTCVGQRLDGARAAGSAHSQELDDMQKLRCEHINSLKETLGLTHLEPHRVGTLDGNRPEISSWPTSGNLAFE
jgi:hypothetical protein